MAPQLLSSPLPCLSLSLSAPRPPPAAQETDVLIALGKGTAQEL